MFAEILSASPLLRIPVPTEDYFNTYYKFYVFLNSALLPPDYSRDRLLMELVARGIPTYSGICPEIYLENAFIDRNLGHSSRLPNAQHLGETSLMFLVHPTLTLADISAMVKAFILVLTNL